MEHSRTYVQLLEDSLEKKLKILKELTDITTLQEQCLNTNTMDLDVFQQTMDKKEVLIQQINELDDGFESIYARVQNELKQNKTLYLVEIHRLQQFIQEITDESVKLKALEARNKIRFNLQFQNEKKKIKNLKASSEKASAYYKNMSNQHQGQSYFLDKKK